MIWRAAALVIALVTATACHEIIELRASTDAGGPAGPSDAGNTYGGDAGEGVTDAPLPPPPPPPPPLPSHDAGVSSDAGDGPPDAGALDADDTSPDAATLDAGAAYDAVTRPDPSQP